MSMRRGLPRCGGLGVELFSTLSELFSTLSFSSGRCPASCCRPRHVRYSSCPSVRASSSQLSLYHPAMSMLPLCFLRLLLQIYRAMYPVQPVRSGDLRWDGPECVDGAQLQLDGVKTCPPPKVSSRAGQVCV